VTRPQNVAASVRQRLLNEARASGRPFNELLQYYAMERFLYRLSVSPHGDKLVLKGALMLTMWELPLRRSTKDIDLLGYLTNDVDGVVAIVRDICRQEVELDGLEFDPGTLQADRIVDEAECVGVRVRFRGSLGTARVSMQIDMGFGDAVVPEPVMFEFKGQILAGAIGETFARRDSEVLADPVALTKEFAVDAARSRQWSGFLRKSRVEGAPDELADVVDAIAVFLGPVTQALHDGRSFDARWVPPGPWAP